MPYDRNQVENYKKKKKTSFRFSTFNVVHLNFFFRHSDCFPLMILKFRKKNLTYIFTPDLKLFFNINLS